MTARVQVRDSLSTSGAPACGAVRESKAVSLCFEAMFVCQYCLKALMLLSAKAEHYCFVPCCKVTAAFNDGCNHHCMRECSSLAFMHMLLSDELTGDDDSVDARLDTSAHAEDGLAENV